MNFKHMKPIFILILVCWFSTSLGQPFTLQGKVIEKNGSGLPYARITDRLINKSVLSNENGFFKIESLARKMELHISFIGYKSIDTTIQFNTSEKSKYINFILTPENKKLNTVEVTSKPYVQVYDTPNQNIIDYTFLGPHIILIVKGDEKYQLKLVNENEEILTAKKLNFHPIGFTKDCFGFKYIVSADTMYQLGFDNDEFIFTDKITFTDYLNLRAPCVAETSELLFLKYISDNNQKITYLTQHKISNGYNYLIVIGDSILIVDRNGQKDGLDAIEGFFQNAGITPGAELNACLLSAVRGLQQDQMFFEHVLNNEFYAPLIKTGGGIFVFDHVIDSCFIFSHSGHLKKSIFLTHHKRSDWEKNIFTDENLSAIYLVFQINGIFTIYEFNQNDGSLTNQTKLHEHTYPKNIKIKNGFVYYLHHELTGNSFNKLFSVKLNQTE